MNIETHHFTTEGDRHVGCDRNEEEASADQLCDARFMGSNARRVDYSPRRRLSAVANSWTSESGLRGSLL